MSSIQNQIKKSKQDYINFSKDNIENTKQYVENIQVINKKTHEIFNLEYDFEKNQKDDYLNIVQRTTYLQNQIIASQEEYIGFFLTLTLPSQYHPYLTINPNTHNKRYIHNKNYDKSNTIHKGYKLLNETMRKIQKDMVITYDKKKDNKKYNKKYKKETLKYIKVIEFHKSLIPHLHGVVYVKRKHVEQFKKHMIKVLGADINEIKEIKNNTNGNTINKTKYNNNKNMGFVELEQLENVDRTIAYLLKYIKKSLNSLNEEEKHLLNGWKKRNRIRIFTMSKVSIPRYIYRKLYNILGKNVVRDDKKSYNFLEKFEKLCSIEIKTIDKDKNEKVRIMGNVGGSSRYSVKVEKEKIINIVKRYEYINNERTNKIIDIEKISYKVIQFVIFDNYTKKEIYNKNDYEVYNQDCEYVKQQQKEQREYFQKMGLLGKNDEEINEVIEIKKVQLYMNF